MKIKNWTYSYSGHVSPATRDATQQIAEALPRGEWPSDDDQAYWDRLQAEKEKAAKAAQIHEAIMDEVNEHVSFEPIC